MSNGNVLAAYSTDIGAPRFVIRGQVFDTSSDKSGDEISFTFPNKLDEREFAMRRWQTARSPSWPSLRSSSSAMSWREPIGSMITAKVNSSAASSQNFPTHPDPATSYPRAITEVLGKSVQHEKSKSINNPVEQSHWKLKQRYYPSMGFSNVETAGDFCTRVRVK